MNPEWWKSVLAPLERLELAATNNTEEMELQTRALTEPLPTNQQAMHLLSLRYWLTSSYAFCFFQRLPVGFSNYLCNHNHLGLQRPSSICP